MTSRLFELSPETLTLPKEKTYFGMMLAVSVLVWLGIAIGLVALPHAAGWIGLLYGAIAAAAGWCVNGLLVSRLRTEGVRVTERQLPALYASHREACAKIGLAQEPELYLLQGNGVLNAFATRHGSRGFVVVQSNLLEALGHDTPEIRFLLGHEIGHLKRNHLRKRLLLLPGLIVPLLGRAYHRACEATCDRHGAFAADNLDGSARAMVALAAGKDAMPRVDAREFAGQYYAQRGFFASWHELASNYPTLCQRVRNLLATGDEAFRRPARRSFWAHPIAFFFNLPMFFLLYLAFFGMALALPAMQQSMKKAQEAQARSPGRPEWLDGAPKRNSAPSPYYQVTVPRNPPPPAN